LPFTRANFFFNVNYIAPDLYSPNSPVELGLNIAQNGTEINNMSLEAEFHPY